MAVAVGKEGWVASQRDHKAHPYTPPRFPQNTNEDGAALLRVCRHGPAAGPPPPTPHCKGVDARPPPARGQRGRVAGAQGRPHGHGGPPREKTLLSLARPSSDRRATHGRKGTWRATALEARRACTGGVGEWVACLWGCGAWCVVWRAARGLYDPTHHLFLFLIVFARSRGLASPPPFVGEEPPPPPPWPWGRCAERPGERAGGGQCAGGGGGEAWGGRGGHPYKYETENDRQRLEREAWALGPTPQPRDVSKEGGRTRRGVCVWGKLLHWTGWRKRKQLDVSTRAVCVSASHCYFFCVDITGVFCSFSHSFLNIPMPALPRRPRAVGDPHHDHFFFALLLGVAPEMTQTPFPGPARRARGQEWGKGGASGGRAMRRRSAGSRGRGGAPWPPGSPFFVLGVIDQRMCARDFISSFPVCGLHGKTHVPAPPWPGPVPAGGRPSGRC